MTQTQRCRQAPGLRKDKAFKIFVNPLAEKQRRVMEAKGKRINLDLRESGDIEVCPTVLGQPLVIVMCVV
jgi:hypothetical protein